MKELKITKHGREDSTQPIVDEPPAAALRHKTLMPRVEEGREFMRQNDPPIEPLKALLRALED